MIKILVTGSRTFGRWDLVKEYFKKQTEPFEIIHGGAQSGGDMWANIYAKRNHIKSTIIRPVRTDIKTYYLHRNAEMVGMCDKVVAFWDGESRGTKFTIDYAISRGKTVEIIKSRG